MHKKLTDSGKRLMATYMQMNAPTLINTIITLELPNHSTKEEFLTGSHELLGYLRSKLHNHEIIIEVVVNEATEKKICLYTSRKIRTFKTNKSSD